MCCALWISCSVVAGAGQVAITSDFMGVQPSSYPVNTDPPVHRRPAGGHHPDLAQAGCPPRRAIPRESASRRRARTAGNPALVRSRRHCQPGDELRLADSHRGGRAGNQSAGQFRVRAKAKAAARQARFFARHAVCAGGELSDAGYHRGPRSRGPVRPHHGGCGTLGESGDLILAFHGSKFLARSGVGERFPDPGAASAESHPGRGSHCQPAGDARRAAARKPSLPTWPGSSWGLCQGSSSATTGSA